MNESMLFGSVPISAQDLANLLLRQVRSEAVKLQERDELKEDNAWTRAVKGIMAAAGEERQLEVLCSGTAVKNRCEWLLDIVWWAHDPIKGREIVLGCESEWSGDQGEVSWDFQKLLCVKAPMKVLIYGGGPNTEIPYGKRVRERVESDIAAYLRHVRGEEYLLVSLDVTGGYAHRYVVPNDGRQLYPQFDLLQMTSASSAG